MVSDFVLFRDLEEYVFLVFSFRGLITDYFIIVVQTNLWNNSSFHSLMLIVDDFLVIIRFQLLF